MIASQNRALADGMRLFMATFIEKKVPGPKGPPGHKNRPAFPRVDFASCNGQGNYDTAPCNLKMTYIEHLSGKSRCEMGQKIQNKIVSVEPNILRKQSLAARIRKIPFKQEAREKC
jgi:hypothetical protein